MKTFSDAFRRNVTVPAALSALLYTEELCCEESLAKKTQTAIENIYSDLQILATISSRFSKNVTETDALNKLIEMAQKHMRRDRDLLPDEAILEAIEDHQLRKFDTAEDIRHDIRLINHAAAYAPPLFPGFA